MKNLIQNILNGKKELFKEIVNKYSPNLLVYYASYLNDINSIDDLVQDTFIIAYKKLDTYKGEADFKTWLMGIAHNNLKMHFRSKDQLAKVSGNYTLKIFEEISSSRHSIAIGIEDDHNIIEKLKCCLKKLPLRLHEVIKERYFSGKKVKIIAQQKNTSETAISSLLYRGRNQLELCIQKKI